MRPQSYSVLRRDYSDPILLECLHARMTEIIGPKLADRFFLSQVNITSNAGQFELDAAYLVPSGDLRRMYLERNGLPFNECFLSNAIRQRIGDLYARDFELIARASDGVQE